MHAAFGRLFFFEFPPLVPIEGAARCAVALMFRRVFGRRDVSIPLYNATGRYFAACAAIRGGAHVTSMGKTLAIVNPAARNGDGARGAAFLRYAAGSAAAPFEGIQIETTREAGHATALAAQASNFDCVLAVGGDGVVHETLAGLMRIPREKRPAFALIPCGNGNDYARTLGMSFVMEEGAYAAFLRAAHKRRCGRVQW